jgi:hypothetical protein
MLWTAATKEAKSFIWRLQNNKPIGFSGDKILIDTPTREPSTPFRISLATLFNRVTDDTQGTR